MAKKAEKADPKKECPSCGLGVNPESSVCEFCGWDFEEEDEWILQIEKLERDLMLEKQKFEPGTVNHMIEATLRTPALEQLERSVPADEDAIEADEEKVEEIPQRSPTASPKKRAPVQAALEPDTIINVRSIETPPPARERPEAQPPVPERKVAAEAPVRKVKPPTAQAPPSVPQRRVRTVASSPSSARPAEQEEEIPTRKVRTVRKVKQ